MSREEGVTFPHALSHCLALVVTARVLQVLHPSAMFPAQKGACNLAIRVRNSYNLAAEGTVIIEARKDANEGLMTSIVLKEDVHLLDISSTRMLGSFGFLARVFDVFRQEQISVDVVATSEISVSVTLDSSKLWSRGLIAEELDNLALRFKGVAEVEVQSGVSIISLICNAQRSSEILKQVWDAQRQVSIVWWLYLLMCSGQSSLCMHRNSADLRTSEMHWNTVQVFTVLDKMGVNVKMISQARRTFYCLTQSGLGHIYELAHICRERQRPTYH